MKLVLFAILFVAPALGQQPSPCAPSDLRAAIAESTALAQQVKVEVVLRHQAERAAAERRSQVESFAAANEKLKQNSVELEATLAERDKTILRLTGERDWALNKIKKANGKWLCEVLHEGCIR